MIGQSENSGIEIESGYQLTGHPVQMFWPLIYKKTKNFKDKIVSGGVLKITDIIIIDTSTPLMSSSVTIWQPPPPLKSAGVLYGWSLKHSNETLTGTTSGM